MKEAKARLQRASDEVDGADLTAAGVTAGYYPSQGAEVRPRHAGEAGPGRRSEEVLPWARGEGRLLGEEGQALTAGSGREQSPRSIPSSPASRR